MVTVVIPCYNQARFLGEAIESVRAQTREGSAAIVVVDDGSTDDTREAALRYEGVHYVWQPNQGQGTARNTGLAHVRTEFVVFLDSDDRLLPNAFEVGLRLLEANPACVLAAGRCTVFCPDGVIPQPAEDPVVERDHYLRLLQANFIKMPGSVLFRTAAVRNTGGFRTTVTGAEDYDLYLRLARTWPIHCHGAVVAEYRQHPTSTSRRPMLMLRSALSVMDAQKPFIKADAVARAAWRAGVRFCQYEYGEHLISLVRRDLRARRWREVATATAALLRYNPHGLARHVGRKLHRLAHGHKAEAADVIEM